MFLKFYVSDLPSLSRIYGMEALLEVVSGHLSRWTAPWRERDVWGAHRSHTEVRPPIH